MRIANRWISSNPLLALVVAICASAGLTCSDSSGVPPGGHELSGEPCEDPITGELAPGPEVLEATQVERYDMALSGAQFNVELSDEANASLGELQTGLELDISTTTGLLKEWRVSTQLMDDGQIPAEQTVRGRDLGEGRIWLEIVHRAGNDELIQWAVVGEEREPIKMSIAVELEAGADPDIDGRMQTPDGRIVDVLDLLDEQGERIAQDEVDAWIDERIGDVFETDPAWTRLRTVGDDLALWQGADAHVRLCQAASVDPTEEELIVREQANCRAESDSSVRRQAQCSDVEQIQGGLEWLLTVNDAMGAVGTGSAITASLVAAGVVTTGPAIGAVFVASALGSILVGNAVEDFVNNNSDSIFDGLFAAGGAATGDREAGRAAASFFKGASNGDPHFDTFDGVGYDFQGVGEFVLVESTTGDPFEIQVRHEPIAGICPHVSVTTAMATRVGDSRVAFYAGESTPLFIDGVPTQVPAGVLPLADGASIEQTSTRVYVVRWPGGERTQVSLRSSRMDIGVGLPESRRGQVSGLLGNFNGDGEDDIRSRDGDILEPPVDWVDLRDILGASWRVPEEDTLFDYDEGEDYSTFFDDEFPARPTRLEDLPDDARQDAEVACEDIDDEVAFDDCVLDVACTGDNEYVDSHADRETDSSLDLNYPIFLDGWIQQGAEGNGNWTVSDDGTSVVQSVNGDPTFFVSPQEYHDVTISGTFLVDQRSDDDFIGFVFGYQSPIAENGDSEDSFDTFLLSWKANFQNSSGFDREAGFVLSHVDGTVIEDDYSEMLWGGVDGPVHRVIDTRLGENLGWADQTEYPFELTYTDDEIVIVIGGEEIFRVDAADSPAPFVPGRFGFYNYSQRDVFYGDFQSGSALDDPTASLAGLEVGVDRPGSNFDEFEMDVGDPRVCRDACLAQSQCDAFAYRRAVYRSDRAYCWLKDDVPQSEPLEGFISGVR